MRKKRKSSCIKRQTKANTHTTMTQHEWQNTIVQAIVEAENIKRKNQKPLSNAAFCKLLFASRKSIQDTNATIELIRSILGACMRILGLISLGITILFGYGIYIFFISHTWPMLIVSFIFVPCMFVFACLCRVSAIEIETTDDFQFLFNICSLLVSFFAMMIAAVSLYVAIKK